MTNTTTQTEQDTISAYQLHYARQPGKSARCLLLGALGFGAYLASENIYVAAAAGGLVGLAVMQAALFFLYLPNRAKRLYRQQKNLHREYRFSWDDQGVFLQAEDYQEKIRWADLSKAKENRTLLLLYPSDHLFHVFPKRSFNNPEQFADFRSHVAALIKN